MVSIKSPDLMGYKHTTIYSATARPRVLGSWKMSASTPVTTAMGPLAKIPDMSLSTSRVAQFLERPHAMVNMVKRKNVPMVRYRRPCCSLMGAHTRGPLDG
jgi:hypothetical protein